MINTELLCRIAIHIKTVDVVDPTNPVKYYDEPIPGCLFCNAYRAGLVDYEFANKAQWSEGHDLFDVSYDDWGDVILLVRCGFQGTGLDYYNALVSLLTKHDQLHVLRRMEGKLDELVVLDYSDKSLEQFITDLTAVKGDFEKLAENEK